MIFRSSIALRPLPSLALLLVLLPLAACTQRGGGDDSDDATTSAEVADTGEGETREDGDDEENDGEEAVPVEIQELERGRIETVLRFSTNLEAENEVEVVSQAGRQLQVVALLVEEGDETRRGQLLLRLQNDEQRTAVARVEGQLARAKREYDRQTSLYDQSLISEQAYNEATYELEQLELSLADAQRELGYTEVRSPIGGTITGRYVSVGDQVTPNQRLFDIVDFDSIVARVYVPERELWRVRRGLEARLLAQAAGREERYGTVERIAPRVDPRSGTVKVTVKIPRGQNLLPGMYVSVELVAAVNEDAVLVPKKALIYDADQIFVFRLTDDDRVERLLIRPLLEDRDHIEPAGVLEPGDRIVVAGQAGLKNGSLVRLVGGAEAPPEPAEEPADRVAAAEADR